LAADDTADARFAPGDNVCVHAPPPPPPVETVHDRDAGEASVLPAASVARTSNVCAEAARPEYAFGDEHAPQLPPSSRHWNDEPDSVELKSNDADVLDTVPDGPAVIDVSGGVVSAAVTFTVHVRDAGEASVFPAASVARTSNVCEPFAKPE
jgi:hypothetical protein